MAGHCIRHPELSNRGRRRLNDVDMLRKDTCVLEKQEIRTSILDRDVWRELSNNDARIEDQ